MECFLKNNFLKLFLSKVEFEISKQIKWTNYIRQLTGGLEQGERQPGNPTGSHPTYNLRLWSLSAQQLVHELQLGFPGRKGCGQRRQGGVLQGRPWLWKTLAFLDPRDTGHTEGISFEAWPGNERVIEVWGEGARGLVRRLSAGPDLPAPAHCTPSREGPAVAWW